MVRFVCAILWLCLAIGVGDALVRMTLEMCRAAAHAHQHDQMSYSKFTRLLTAPARSSARRSEK